MARKGQRSLIGKTAPGMFPSYPKGRVVELGPVRLRVYWIREMGSAPGHFNEGWRWRCGSLEGSQLFDSMEEAMWEASERVPVALEKALRLTDAWKKREREVA